MKYDTLIIGAGAAGMMCAIHIKGRIFLVKHNKAPRKKFEFLVVGVVTFQIYTRNQKISFQKISKNDGFQAAVFREKKHD